MSKTYYHVTLDAVVEAEDLGHAYSKAYDEVGIGNCRITILKQGGARAALVAKDEKDFIQKMAARTKVEDLEWHTRTINQLNQAGIKTLGELSKWSADELLARRGFGRRCLIEVQDTLEAYGLALRETQAEMQLEAAE
jgi:DNA-directed RNA polymerase alpha subunit